MPNCGKQVCWRAHSHIHSHSHRQRWRRRYEAVSDVSNGCNLQLQFYCLAAHAAPNESYRRSLVFLSINRLSRVSSVLLLFSKNKISLWVFLLVSGFHNVSYISINLLTKLVFAVLLTSLSFQNVLWVLIALTIIYRSVEMSFFTIDTCSGTLQSKFANESVSLSYPEFV